MSGRAHSLVLDNLSGMGNAFVVAVQQHLRADQSRKRIHLPGKVNKQHK